MISINSLIFKYFQAFINPQLLGCALKQPKTEKLCMIRLPDFMFSYSSLVTAYLKELHTIMKLHLTGLRFSIDEQKCLG